MTEPSLVAIDLTDDERYFMALAVNEYRGPAGKAYRLLAPVLGLTNKAEWDRLIDRLIDSLRNGEPLSDLDWARSLFLVEISFGSSLVGCGLDFERGSDGYRLELLRNIQYKVSSYARFSLLLENAGYPAAK